MCQLRLGVCYCLSGWSTHWFSVEVRVPDEWMGKEVQFRCTSQLTWGETESPLEGLFPRRPDRPHLRGVQLVRELAHVTMRKLGTRTLQPVLTTNQRTTHARPRLHVTFETAPVDAQTDTRNRFAVTHLMIFTLVIYTHTHNY